MDKPKDSAKNKKMPPVRHSEAGILDQESYAQTATSAQTTYAQATGYAQPTGYAQLATYAQVATLVCTLANLRVLTRQQTAETILDGEELVTLGVTVDFGNSGAIALMPLGLQIRVDFFAKPIGRGEDLELGAAILHTAAHQFTYHPTLAIAAGLANVGMVPETAYRLTALLRVGAPDYPAFVTGVLDGLMIQIYSPD